MLTSTFSHQLIMKNFLRLFLFSSLFCSTSFGQESSRSSDYLITSIDSEILSAEKEIFISLPENIDEQSGHPVIIVLEAELLFESFAPLTRLMSKMKEIPECVVVGIPFHNQHLDYAPKIKGIPESGNADNMLSFFEKELFPLLETKYHCNQERIIWAHSGLSGIFCTYLVLGPDNQFSGVLSSSPNLKWVQQYIIPEDAFKLAAGKKGLFYYLTVGGEEAKDESSEISWYTQEFHKKLKESSPENLNWHFRINNDANHFSNAFVTYLNGLKLYFEEAKEK